MAFFKIWKGIASNKGLKELKAYIENSKGSYAFTEDIAELVVFSDKKVVDDGMKDILERYKLQSFVIYLN